jgi:hypothetical protein
MFEEKSLTKRKKSFRTPKVPTVPNILILKSKNVGILLTFLPFSVGLSLVLQFALSLGGTSEDSFDDGEEGARHCVFVVEMWWSNVWFGWSK